MDKNQSLGLLLIFLILIGWSWFTTPTPAEIEAQNRAQDSIEQIKALELEKTVAPVEKHETAVIESDSVKLEALTADYGDNASLALGKEALFTLENDNLIITFSNKGGIIKEARLKKYSKILKDSANQELKIDVRLLEDTNNKFEYILALGNKNIKTSDIYFESQQNRNELRFKVTTENGAYFEQVYSLGDDYTLDYYIQFDGIKASGKDNNSIVLNWVNFLDKIELNTNFEKTYSTVYFKDKIDDSIDYCSCRDDDEISLESTVEWVSHTHQFFNSTLIAEEKGFSYADFEIKMPENENDENLKRITSNMGIPLSAAGSPFKMQMYIGPNEFSNLKSFDNDLEEIIPFGRSIFGTINRFIIRPFFEFLARHISSKGIVLIVLIFLIKILLYPLMYKMLHSQAKMQALKPRLATLTEKYKDDAQKKQVETMKIYREYGVSPFGGCMPMVLQMPIWYALFRFFPASITFRQEPFLWASDLSSYDVFFELSFEIPMMGSHLSLFTILWAITTVMYTFYNTKHMDMSANPAMKYVQYFMPIMFLGFFNSYASGLTCYMFFSNLFNIAQTVLTKKFIFNDERILKELEVKKEIMAKNPKKKSGFQARLEEAMKQQQAVQKRKEINKKNKKK